VLAPVWVTIIMIDRAGGQLEEDNHGRRSNNIDNLNANPAGCNQLAPPVPSCRRRRTASNQCIRMSHNLRSTSPLVLEELPLSITRREPWGSDDELGERDRAAKRRRIEQLAEDYRHGQSLFIASAALRGPLDDGGWENPWRKKRPVRRPRSRTTNDKEEGTGDQRCRTKSRRRGNGVHRGETSGERSTRRRTPRTLSPEMGEEKDREPRTMERTRSREDNTHASMPDDDNQESRTERASNPSHPTNSISEGTEMWPCAQVVPQTAVSDCFISLHSTQLLSHLRQPPDVSKENPDAPRSTQVPKGLRGDGGIFNQEDGRDGNSGSRAVSPTSFRVPRMTGGTEEIPTMNHPQGVVDSGTPGTGRDSNPGSTSGMPFYVLDGSTELQDGQGTVDSFRLNQAIEEAGTWLHEGSSLNWELSRCNGNSDSSSSINPRGSILTHRPR
jgi:hypothetical protein